MEMKARTSLAFVTEGWEAFQKLSGLRHIENSADYDELVALADTLVDAGAMQATHPCHSLFQVIADLIYAYDQRHYLQAEVHGVDLLRFLMEQHDLRQNQLPEIGTQSVVSEILAGKRELTVNHIRALAKRFALSPAAFF
jgi:HTH-type transcriptional regulator/antitoxin HigA